MGGTESSMRLERGPRDLLARVSLLFMEHHVQGRPHAFFMRYSVNEAQLLAPKIHQGGALKPIYL